MIVKHQTIISKDPGTKKIIVKREFDAPLAQVWQAWTDASLLDQWWAPKPWKAKTKSMDFREGGNWIYCMVGPDKTEAWARADFKKIVRHKQVEIVDAFCDENGKLNTDMPVMHWTIRFTEAPPGTNVEVEITFDSQADMDKIIEMGFEEGFTAAHGNLDEVLAK